MEREHAFALAEELETTHTFNHFLSVDRGEWTIRVPLDGLDLDRLNDLVTALMAERGRVTAAVRVEGDSLTLR